MVTSFGRLQEASEHIANLYPVSISNGAQQGEYVRKSKTKHSTRNSRKPQDADRGRTTFRTSLYYDCHYVLPLRPVGLYGLGEAKAPESVDAI